MAWVSGELCPDCGMPSLGIRCGKPKKTPKTPTCVVPKPSAATDKTRQP